MRNSRWMVFAICASFFILSQFYRASNAVIAPELCHDLGLTAHDLGLLGALFFYIFAFVQFPLGYLLDHFGAKRTMVGLNLIGVAGALVFAWSSSLAGGLAGRALLGLGMSANLMGGLKLFTQWFKPREFATVSGVLASLGAIGSLAATSPFVLLVNMVGWRWAFVVVAVLNAAVTVSMVMLVPGQAPEDEHPKAEIRMVKAGPSMRESFRRLLVDRSFWAISAAAGVRYGVYAAFQSLWAGPFLILYLGLPKLTAGNLMLMLTVGFILGAPFGGMLSDRVFKSRKATVLLSLVLIAAGLALLAVWPGPVHLFLLGLLLFLFAFFAAFGQILYAHIKELMPQEMSGTAMAGVNFFVMGGAGVFVHGLGSIIGGGDGAALGAGSDYTAAFWVCFWSVAAATVVYLFSRDVKVDQG